MKNGESCIYGFIGGIVLLLLPLSLNAQEDTLSIPQTQTPESTEEEGSAHSLFAGAGIGNSMVYMGSSLSQDKPYYFGSITYGFRDKIYASVASFNLAAYDPLLAFNTFSLNYSEIYNSWFDLSATASRYQVNNQLVDTLFSSFFYGDLTLGFDWKILYTKLSAGGIFAESSGIYLQMRNSRYFETPAFFNGNAYISFDPNVNMLFGTLTETTTPDGTVTGVTQPFNSKKSSGRGSVGTTTKEYFSLMEVDIGIPVSFNYGKFTLEADAGYIFPLYSDTDPLNPKGFSLLISCYLQIF